MKHAFLLILVGCLMGLTGCGDSQKSEAEKAARAARKSFDTAPEELKTQYQALKSALDSDDLPKAMEALNKLNKAELTVEQQMAVAELNQSLVLKASTAAQNGDEKAAKFLLELRMRTRSR